MSDAQVKHAFVSYVHEDADAVDQLTFALHAASIPVWRDTQDLWPGEDWQIKIRQAIEGGSLAFIACFSTNSVQKNTSYMNAELRLAVEQIRLMKPGQVWLLPVRLDDCELPYFDIGNNRTLDSLQRIDFFGPNREANLARLITAVRGIFGNSAATPATAAAVVPPPQPSALAARSKPEVLDPAPALSRGIAITDRWHHTPDGGKVPSLMRLTQTSVLHPRYSGREWDKTPPSVKIGMLVGCEPIDPRRSGSELRAKFLSFLGSPTVRTLIDALTHVAPDASWKSLAGNGPRTLEAALTAGADPLEDVPVASALLLLPTAQESLYGRDERSATLMLYIEPRMADELVPSASSLRTWSKRFALAFAVPRALDDFLSAHLGLTTTSNPPAQLGIWLESHQPLTVMVDIDGLRVLPGRSPSNQFIGWTFAAPDGKPATAVARDLIVELCEYTLRLDDFEQNVFG
jgi:hypothetical protein